MNPPVQGRAGRPFSHIPIHVLLTLPPSRLHSKELHGCGSEEVRLLPVPFQLQLELGTDTAGQV